MNDYVDKETVMKCKDCGWQGPQWHGNVDDDNCLLCPECNEPIQPV